MPRSVYAKCQQFDIFCENLTLADGYLTEIVNWKVLNRHKFGRRTSSSCEVALIISTIISLGLPI
jgi:hypothetical protein